MTKAKARDCRSMGLLLAVPLGLFLACSTSATNPGNPESVPNPGEGGSGSGSGGSGSSTSERTLENCETSIADNAPAFFQVFRCVSIDSDGTSVSIETKGLPPHRS